jgi:hydrogenase expression/formation protein HypD
VKYVDEYRDARLGRAILDDIRRIVTRPWTIMEICGGQTHTIVKHGIDELLPEEVQLVHGPGCPVCVTRLEVIDKALEIAARPEVIFVSYGDMLRVPGSAADLFAVRARGADVRLAYSPVEALKIARANPDRKVVFFAIGFETTAPAHALAVRLAKREGLTNFSLLVSHVLAPPAVRAILDSPANRVQGFIAPGHVCAIEGYTDYEDLSREFRVPIVVGGFEPLDLIEAIRMLVLQLEQGRAETENQYVRSVTREGNTHARRAVAEVFEIADQKWRGIGLIPRSGLRLREEYAAHDASRLFGLEDRRVDESSECISAQVMRGLQRPADCPAFRIRCTPETPLGALMVSSEGACAAYFRYKAAGKGAA